MITIPPIGLNKPKGRWAQFRSLENNELGAGNFNLPVFMPAGLTAGDVLLAFVYTRNSSSFGIFPDAWTTIHSASPVLDGTTHYIYVLRRIATGGESTADLQWDTGNQNKGAVILAYKGAHATQDEAINAGTLAVNSTSHPGPNITPTYLDSLVVRCWFFDATGSGIFGGVATEAAMDYRFGTSDSGFGGVSDDAHRIYDEKLYAAGVPSPTRTVITNNACSSYGVAVGVRRA